jgi:hypothetical protein
MGGLAEYCFMWVFGVLVTTLGYKSMMLPLLAKRLFSPLGSTYCAVWRPDLRALSGAPLSKELLPSGEWRQPKNAEQFLSVGRLHQRRASLTFPTPLSC